ncbi:MAG: hypothetical protein ABS54_04000 [Hyphomicrobium sp. SCN 65-11]|nr:MAG: hypothetical protein ABS54_04000 [Hyphomicrobium sp. SCN 65-11]
MYGRVLKATLLSLCLGLVTSKNLCAQDTARFGIYGSNTIGARLMPNLVEAYAASAGASTARSASNDPEQVELNLTNRTGAPLALVDIRSHGSGTGIPALIDGKASIAMLSRPISEKETLALQQAGLPDLRSAEYAHVLAMDGILVFVSPKNPLATLSLDEIAGIFAGTIRDWGAVGGVPGPINVYARDNKSGTFDTFNSLVLRTRNLALRKDAKQFESSEELSDEVARDPNGIGFSGFAYLRSAKALDIATECGITSKPTTFNVKSEEYPLSRRLFLYTKPLANGTVPANVLRYALSMDARPSILAAGYIDQEFEWLDKGEHMLRFAKSLALSDPDIDAALLKQLAGDLQAYSRMSTTFRFDSNSATLDNKSIADVQRLARFVRFLVETRQSRTIILAGFTDSVGDFASNATLSLTRAEQVKAAVIKAAGVAVPAETIITRGYSKLLPTACNSSDAGRHSNRRVESWFR